MFWMFNSSDYSNKCARVNSLTQTSLTLKVFWSGFGYKKLEILMKTSIYIHPSIYIDVNLYSTQIFFEYFKQLYWSRRRSVIISYLSVIFTKKFYYLIFLWRIISSVYELFISFVIVRKLYNYKLWFQIGESSSIRSARSL